MTISFTTAGQFTWSFPANGINYIKAVDINGDRVSDIFIAPNNWPPVPDELTPQFLLSNANITFSNHNLGIAGGVSTVVHVREIITDDFNGDGLNDLFIADHGYDTNPWPGHQNILYLSGSGTLNNATSGIPSQIDFTHSVGAGDVDGDGDLDLIIGNTYGQNNFDPIVLRNNGSGAFSIIEGAIPNYLIDISAGSNTYSSQKLIDLNNDGLADLVLGADIGHGTTNILYNQGNGTFSSVSQVISGPYGQLSSAVDIDNLDINSDGRTDLLITYYSADTFTGAYTQVMVQNADGLFVDETSSRLPNQTGVNNSGDFRQRVVLSDLDADGDLDALATYMGPNVRNPEIWTNNNGVFSIASIEGHAILADLGDFDGNGAMDLLLFNGVNYEIRLNNAVTATRYGTHDSDNIVGTANADSIFGNNGNDTITGGAGSDVISGGAGSDTVVFSVARSAATVVESGSNVLVTDDGGVDTLNGIENYRFSDGTYLLSDLLAPTDTANGIYRFNNTANGTHFYTASTVERDIIINGLDSFNYESVSFVAANSSNSASSGVHRFNNTQTGTHFYTISNEEKGLVDQLSQYRYEGEVFSGYTEEVTGSVPLYRFFNTQAGTHFYTPSSEEKDIVIETIPFFRFEGIAYWVDAA